MKRGGPRKPSHRRLSTASWLFLSTSTTSRSGTERWNPIPSPSFSPKRAPRAPVEGCGQSRRIDHSEVKERRCSPRSDDDDSPERPQPASTPANASALVFPNTEGNRDLRWAKKAVPAAIRTAQIEDFRFHDLRHTFASRLAMEG